MSASPPPVRRHDCRALSSALTGLLVLALPAVLRAEHVWVEGEKPAKASVSRHPWWYDQVQRDKFSGGDFISHWHDKKAGEVEYRFEAPRPGEYEFWVRANPVGTSLSYKLNSAAWVPLDMDKQAVDSTNVAPKGAIDVRFLAWVKAGTVTLAKGENTVQFRMDSKNNNHGMIDCFVFSTEPFRPRGALKPGEAPKVA